MGGVKVSKGRKCFKWSSAEKSRKMRTENEPLIQHSGDSWLYDKYSLHGVMVGKPNWNGLRSNVKWGTKRSEEMELRP